MPNIARSSRRARACGLALRGLAWSALLGACASSAPPVPRTAAEPARAADAAPRALPSDLWPARVLALVNEHRHAARAAPLAPSSALSAIAADAARACFADGAFDEQAVLARAHRELERHALVYRRVLAVVTLAADPADAAAHEAALDPDARSVGIGVARGRLEGSSAERVAVVLVLGTPR